MAGLEEERLPNVTVKNMAVTIISTISIVVSVMCSYFGLRGDIADVKNQQETTTRVNEIRLKTLEAQVGLLQQQVQQLRDDHIKITP